MESWDKSDTVYSDYDEVLIGENDIKLAQSIADVSWSEFVRQEVHML